MVLRLLGLFVAAAFVVAAIWLVIELASAYTAVFHILDFVRTISGSSS